MTLEYDLALANHKCLLIVTDACTHTEALRSLFDDSTATPNELSETLTKARADTAHLPVHDREAHVAATCYLDCIDSAKGEHALALARALKDAKGTPAIVGFSVPSAIVDVIRWASRQPAAAPPAA
jgi:hypothetical protein